MIGKVPCAGTGFRGVVSYLMRGKRDAPDPNRVAWAETRNLPVIDPDRAPTVMRSTANQSIRCQRPVYHFVVSWHKDEAPDDELMRAVGDTTLADLNLTDHQAILIAHTDTAHKHLHVVVNRVHPETCRAWSKEKDWARLEISLGRQAKNLGLRFVPGRHNDPERFAIVPKRPRDGEYQAAIRHGEPQPRRQWSKQQIANRRTHIAAMVDAAQSWDHLAAQLATQGLDLARKGQGIILGDDSGYLKLSDLRKDIRLGALQDRYRETFDVYAKRAAESDTATHARHEHTNMPAPTPPHPTRHTPRPTTHARKPMRPHYWSRHTIDALRPQLTPAFETANSWADLDLRLNQQGIGLQATTGGLILTDGSKYMLLSAMGEDINRTALEARFIETFKDFTANSPHPRLGPQMPPGTPGLVPLQDAQARSPADTARDIEDEQIRIAAERAQRHAQGTTSSDQDDPPADAPLGAPARQPQPAAPMSRDNAGNTPERAAAQSKLQGARESLNMAHTLSNLGISTDLDAARRDVEAAQEDLEKHLTFKEKLNNQLGDVFAPDHQQQPAEEATEEQKEALREERRQQRLREAAQRKAEKKKHKGRGGRGR